MLNVAICDEELELAKKMRQKITSEGVNFNLSITSSCYRIAEEMLWDMEARGSFDIVFMSIVDSKEIGMVKQIIKANPYCLIIFLSDTAALAYDTFEVHPFSFIKKPIDWKLFQKTFQEASNRITKMDEVFRFRSNRIFYQIPMHNILYFQSEKRKIRMYCQNGEEILFYSTLNAVEEYIQILSLKFIRIHQSFLINRAHIKQYCCEEIHMINGVRLPISEEKKKVVKTKIMTGNICVT